MNNKVQKESVFNIDDTIPHPVQKDLSATSSDKSSEFNEKLYQEDQEKEIPYEKILKDTLGVICGISKKKDK